MILSFLKNLRRKDQMKKLVTLAVSKGLLSEADRAYLEEQAHLKGDKITDNAKLEALIAQLPSDKEERFALAYSMLESQMKRGGISHRMENVLKAVLKALNISSSRSSELVDYLKINIRNGLSKEESYKRLGYLVE